MTPPQIGFAFTIEAGEWGGEAELEDLIERVLVAAVLDLSAQEKQSFPEETPEVSLVFTDDASMAEINGRWRGLHKPTNVLSFPAMAIAPGDMPGALLGDIVLAWETIARECAEQGKSFEDHLTHLIVHGFLHLFGYDHVRKADAEKMESVETRILASLHLSDPYGGLEPE